MSYARVKTGGRYKHYKGNIYVVVGVAAHSETGEELVIYRQEESGSPMFARPLEMFVQDVEWGGKTVPRFLQLEF
jgi:hypothetical protein